MFWMGEALLGGAAEISHVEVMIGSKEEYVGQAFIDAFSNPTVGHTPLLAVIRPNLPCKPLTLIVPKVTVKGMEDTGKIFGPAQAAVAKAVADSVEEGIIPEDKIDEWVIICSVFIHPQAKDYTKIYLYNYSATKLAIKRALRGYPGLKKIMREKERAIHPIMGFRMHHNLWRPPYLQINLDIPSLDRVSRIAETIPQSDRIIFEVSGPLYRRHGQKAIERIRDAKKGYFVFVDLGIPHVPKAEVDLAFDATANGVIASGEAPKEVLDSFIYEAKRMGIYAALNFENFSTDYLIKKIDSLKDRPHSVILPFEHKKSAELSSTVKEMRKKLGKVLIAVSGEIIPSTSERALKCGADILRVDRYVTQSKDAERAVREFLMVTPEMRLDIDQFRKHVE